MTEARKLGKEVIDRCNLTVLLEPHQEDLAEFLAKNKVHIIASLPCYLEDNVDGQRGDQVFQRSIRGLQLLNEQGYGREGSGLVLDLVYNPTGFGLAPPASKLSDAYVSTFHLPGLFSELGRERRVNFVFEYSSMVCFVVAVGTSEN